MNPLDRFRNPGTPNVLVENRTSAGGDDLEFSVYDTYQQEIVQRQNADGAAAEEVHP